MAPFIINFNCGLYSQVFDSRQRQPFCSLLKRPDRLWCPHSLLFNGYQGLFPREVKQSEREADLSPQVPRLRMSAVMHLLCLCVFITCAKTTFPFPDPLPFLTIEVSLCKSGVRPLVAWPQVCWRQTAIEHWWGDIWGRTPRWSVRNLPQYLLFYHKLGPQQPEFNKY